MTVEEAPVGKIRRFAGIVRSTEFSQLSFDVGGLISSIYVDIGAHVKKGQVLAVLDEEPYRLEVDAARAELDKAQASIVNMKAEYERQLRVFEQGAGTQSRVDQAKYDYDAAHSSHAYAVSQLKLSQRNLRNTSLAAPYDGYIAVRSAEPHEKVQPGQEILEINAAGDMDVVLAVSETNIANIRVADPATITFPTLPGQTLQGSVREVGSAAIKANSFPVKIALKDPPAAVSPGMTAEVSLRMTEREHSAGILIPLQAFLPSGESWHGHVFVYDPAGSAVKKRPVRCRGMENNMAIVEEGLTPGEIIAQAGVTFLADGMRVSVVE